MASGVADIKAADPPPESEPNAPSPTHVPEAHGEAEKEPRNEEEESGLEENGLGLRESGEDGLREEGTVGDAGTKGPLVGSSGEEGAIIAGGCGGEEVAGIAYADTGIEKEGIVGTQHHHLKHSLESRLWNGQQGRKEK
ncbi:hypothetical protein ACLOJK_024283 [Asimina triloba]